MTEETDSYLSRFKTDRAKALLVLYCSQKGIPPWEAPHDAARMHMVLAALRDWPLERGEAAFASAEIEGFDFPAADQESDGAIASCLFTVILLAEGPKRIPWDSKALIVRLCGFSEERAIQALDEACLAGFAEPPRGRSEGDAITEP